MIRHKVRNHFLPHYFIDPEFVPILGGGHHRAHGLSLWALFFYLQILAVATAGLFIIQLKKPQILGTVNFSAQQIIDLTNAKRAQNNLPPLVSNEKLTAAASAKAADMITSDYWAHNSPTGKTPWSFITAIGYHYIFAGENLARDFSDAPSVVDAWMASPSHRSNLLDSNFKEIGVVVTEGKLQGREGTLVVQMFGTSLSQVQKQPTVSIIQPSPPPATSHQPPATSQISVLASRKFAIAKTVSLVLVSFIFVLFALEIVITLRRAHVKLRSGVLAHLGLLAFVLLAVWYAVAGVIK